MCETSSCGVHVTVRVCDDSENLLQQKESPENLNGFCFHSKHVQISSIITTFQWKKHIYCVCQLINQTCKLLSCLMCDTHNWELITEALCWHRDQKHTSIFEMFPEALREKLETLKPASTRKKKAVFSKGIASSSA